MILEDRLIVQSAAYSVFEALGPWHTEKVYQNALRVELGDVLAQVEETVPIFYKDIYVGFQRLDLTWKNHVIEVKTLNAITRKECGQCDRYRRTTKKSVALINFTPKGPVLEFFDSEKGVE